MPISTHKLLNCHHALDDADRGSKYHLLTGYSATNKQESIYSPASVPILVMEYGTCIGYGFDRDLVNGYCECCRVLGANEAQCVNPKLSVQQTRNAGGRVS